MEENNFPPVALIVGSSHHQLSKSRVVIGREPEGVDIVIADPSLSRKHAQFEHRDGKWFLEDLGSKNKTFINKQAIPPNQPVEISAGTQVHFGKVGASFDGHQKIDATIAFDPSAIPGGTLFAQKGGASAPAPRPGGTVLNLERPSGAPPGRSAPGAASPASSDPASTAFGYLERRTIDRPERLYILKDHVRIGSEHRYAELLVRASDVAPLHAEIRFYPDKRIVLKDFSHKTKKNATRVKGRPTTSANISDGDELEFGDASFQFHVLRYPDPKSHKKKSGFASIALIFLTLLLAGGGIYYYYFYMQRQEEDRPVVVGQVRVSLSQVTDKVARGAIRDASDQTERLLRTENLHPDDKEHLMGFREPLDLFEDIVDARDVSNAPEAYSKAKIIGERFQENEIAIAGRPLLDEAKRNYEDWKRAMLLRIDEADRKGDWDTAQAQIRALESAPDGPDLSIVKKRISLGRELQGVYTSGLRDIDQSYMAVLNKAEKVIASAEEQSAGSSELREAVAPRLRLVKDLRANAMVIKAYREFENAANIKQLYDLYNDISPEYDQKRRDDVMVRVQRLETIMSLQGIYSDAWAKLSAATADTPDVEKIRLTDEMISNRKDVLAIDDSPQFLFSRAVREEIRTLEKFKRERIVSSWKDCREAVARGGTSTLDLDFKQRECAFRILKLFPAEARRDPDDSQNVPTIINDQELLTVFEEAMSQYRNSGRRIVGALYEAYVNRSSESLGMPVPQALKRLVDCTLEEDQNMRQQLNRITSTSR